MSWNVEVAPNRLETPPSVAVTDSPDRLHILLPLEAIGTAALCWFACLSHVVFISWCFLFFGI